MEICVLKLKKVLMYEYHHDYIRHQNDNKSKLLLRENDGLSYVIKTYLNV